MNKLIITLTAMTLSINAYSHGKADIGGDCYVTDRGNVAACINRRTLQPCTVINDTNVEHVKHHRARESEGKVYLVGTNIPIGDMGGTYNISTYDGLAWYAGECK